MAIVTKDVREIMFEDGTIMKLNAGESIEDAVAKLEAAGIVVNVF
jgi:hypothetical protein